MTQHQGQKRRREAIGTGAARQDSGTPKEPSREAKAAWNNDFPTKFHVLDKIGEGSFGTVWLGRRRRNEEGINTQQHSKGGGRQGDEHLVAIKRINPTCSPSRILNEFEQMRKLRGGQHNVIQVQGVVRTPGGVFALVMPYFEHDDFRQVIKTLTLSGVAAYARSLLTALAHVHAHGVIHRDIKPRNFMYNANTGQGVLIDFGLAEPAEKWQGRSEALARHRDKRSEREARGKQSQATPTSKQRAKVPTGSATRRATGSHEKPRPPSSAGASTGRQGPPSTAETAKTVAGRITKAGSRGSASATSGREMEDRLKLLKKVERGGTTGFRAPEILWHCRDQAPAVDVWSAGVILLCLLSRRYPVFPCADSDEMALVQIAMLLGGADGIIRAARESGRCHIAEFPSVRQPGRGAGAEGDCASRLEELCAPLLGCGSGGGGGGGGDGGVAGPGAAACDQEENKARADALSLLKAMLKVDPRERLTAKDALLHPFVANACSIRAGKAAAVHSSASISVSQKSTSVAAAPSLWTGARERGRSTAVLGMSVETVEQVTVADLEDREFQLEELEDKDVAETSVVLNKDGSVTAGATNGPIPISVRGKWSFDGTAFRLDLHREFDATIPYMVSRVMTGYVEEVLSATDTLIITGDIEMEGMDVGFFKMISSPSDIVDSLKHLDQQIADSKSKE
eukprot:g7275.t1